ncbi:MAG TPA: LCP family protein [Acidimicrobiales bacterium]|nr:LCP family protein [Acidimicrobiales bacterium]
MAVASGGARLRRSWPQRLLIGFNVVLIVACLSGAGGLAYLYQRFGDLPRIDFGSGVLEKPPEDPGEPQNFLLVGSDDRADLEDAEAFGTAEQTGEAKSDTIMLVRVDPQAETAAMLSFPRDLMVEIAGTGEEDRINKAFTVGGPEGARRLIDTIKLNFNIPVHHYAQVDFEGFQRVVDAVGGINVYLPNPVRDYDPGAGRNQSGLDIQQTGCIELNGEQALSYVRSRYFQERINGRWRADPTGDLGRTQRQQDFVRRALNKALSEDLLNPVRLNRLVDVAIDTVQVDRGLGVDDIVELGERFRDLSPDRLQQYALNEFVENARTPAGAAVLELQDGPEVQAIFDVFRGEPVDADRPVSPSSVTVQVLNGTGRPGEASTTTEGLSGAGFHTRPPGDEDSGGASTTILYASGQEAKADLVSRYLVAEGAVLREASGLEAADVVLVTGTDFEGIRDEPREPDATTTSTPEGATTTTAPELSEDEAQEIWLEAVARNQCLD